MGRLLAWSLLAFKGWWLQEATALRVGLFDGPDCLSKAVQDSARTRSSRRRCRQ